MSTFPQSSPAISQAFDREADGYALRWNNHELVRNLRTRVIGSLRVRVPPPARILDLGCGVGTDVLLLGALGYEAQGVDASPEMVRRAVEAGAPAQVASIDCAADVVTSRMQAVLSNFGVVNCLPSLAPLRRAAEALLEPRGYLLVVSMSPSCPAETGARLLRGQRSRRGRPSARVSGVEVPLSWWTAGELDAGLGADFVRVHTEALGLLVPPPDLGGVWRRRLALEPWLGRLPGLRNWGDHTLHIWRRAA